MTPENWPEPVAFRDDGTSGGYGQPSYRVATHETVTTSMHPSTAKSFTEPLYTATQVREIVRMEVEQLKLDADEMVRQMLDAMASSKTVRVSDDYLAAMRDARKWLKENKDAD
ncbi:hypothetical protein [Curvibacter lanceolatus]|uniref:hypothetical protein n=1 Tax=Curvibacter lanceolatus TaxID=86182 RepID=UPI0003633892|nr:hypothetical protein [Curvibacter lanceolatus]